LISNSIGWAEAINSQGNWVGPAYQFQIIMDQVWKINYTPIGWAQWKYFVAL
jgi:hypothetical protein